MHYSTGWGVHRDGDQRVAHFRVERYPWWVYVAERATDTLCRLTHGRSCRWLCTPVIVRLHHRHEAFEIHSTPERVAEFEQWRGRDRPFFMNDDGTQVGYSDNYTQMP